MKKPSLQHFLNQAIILIIGGLLLGPAQAQTNIPVGDVSGTWGYSGSPYLINGEINIPDSDELIIEPGVEVIFTGNYQFFIYGTLLAIGSPNEMISFTAQDTTVGWLGLFFKDIDPENDSSKVMYSKISRVYFVEDTATDVSGRGIGIVSSDKVQISYCEITHNTTIGYDLAWGAGITVQSCSPVITNNFIAYNSATLGPTIHGGGVALIYDADPVFNNNIIYKNVSHGGAGVVCFRAKPTLINNTIVGNHGHHGSGIDFLMGSATVINCIIYGNTAVHYGVQIHFGFRYDAGFFHCLIEGGRNGFCENHTSSAPSFAGEYTGCMDKDPKFEIMGSDFQLRDISPCIGQGTLSASKFGKTYYTPSNDFANNPRPWPARSNPDIGAFENPLADPITSISDPIDMKGYAFLLKPYPNPVAEVAHLPYQVNKPGHVSLEIIDLTGKTLAVLESGNQSPGLHQVTWHTADIANGIYMCRLSMQGMTDSKIIRIQK